MVSALVALAALVAAVIARAEGASADSQPGQGLICVAEQWTATRVHGYVNVHNGQFEIGEITNQHARDAINERERYVTTHSDRNGPKPKMVFYMFYKDKMMYSHNTETGTCIKQILDIPFRRRCVPVSARTLDPEVVYGLGAGKNITAFRIRYIAPRKDGTSVLTTMTVTDHGVPILQRLSIVAAGGAGISTEAAEFTEVQFASTPDSLFDLPPSCASATYGRPEYYPSIAFDL